MHLQSEPTPFRTISVVKMLLILLITYTTFSTANSSLTPEEIAQVVNDVAPERFCGRKLTESMRLYCSPAMRGLIQRQSNPVKKSCKKTKKKILWLYFHWFKFSSGSKFRFLRFRILWSWPHGCRALRRWTSPIKFSLQGRRELRQWHPIHVSFSRSPKTSRNHWWVLQEALPQNWLDKFLPQETILNQLSGKETLIDLTYISRTTLPPFIWNQKKLKWHFFWLEEKKYFNVIDV